jgi:hypothetical protein
MNNAPRTRRSAQSKIAFNVTLLLMRGTFNDETSLMHLVEIADDDPCVPTAGYAWATLLAGVKRGVREAGRVVFTDERGDERVSGRPFGPRRRA